MSGLIGSIAIGMSVDAAGVDAGVGKASSSLSRFGSSVGKSLGSFPGLDKLTGSLTQMGDSLSGGMISKALPQVQELGGSLASAAATGGSALAGLATAAVAAVAAIAAAGAGIVAFGVSSMKPAAELIHLSERLGTSVDGLKELHYVATLSGSSVETMDMAIGKLSVNLGKAQHGSTPAAVALEQIGLSAKQLAAMDPAAAMELIIANFDKFPTAADQAAAAMELFGKGGIGMLGTLKLGKEGLAKLTAETAGMKGALDGIKGQQILEANASMEKLSMAWSGMGTLIAVQIAPAVTSVMTLMSSWLKSACTSGTILNGILTLCTGAIKGLVSGIGAAMTGAGNLYEKTASAVGAGKEKRVGPGKDYTAAGKWNPTQARLEREKAATAKSAAPVAPKAAAISNETMEAIVKGREWSTTLREQVATFGMTADAAELYKLKLAGIPEQDVKNIGSLIQLKTQMEQSKAVFEQMKTDALGFYNDTRTPGEKLLEQQTKLNQLLNAGMISRQTYDRAMKADLMEKAKSVIEETRTPLEMYQKKLSELDQLLQGGAIDTETFNRAATAAEKSAVGDNKPKFASMAEMGSKEAYSAITQFQAQSNRADDPQKKLVKNSDEAIKIAREHLELAKRSAGGSGLPVFQFSS